MRLETAFDIGPWALRLGMSGRGLACLVASGYKGFGDATNNPIDPTYLLYVAGATAAIDGWEVWGETDRITSVPRGMIAGIPSTAIVMGAGYAMGWGLGKAQQFLS